MTTTTIATGTLHIEDVAIPGSIAALTRLLQERGIGVRFGAYWLRSLALSLFLSHTYMHTHTQRGHLRTLCALTDAAAALRLLSQ